MEILLETLGVKSEELGVMTHYTLRFTERVVGHRGPSFQGIPT